MSFPPYGLIAEALMTGSVVPFLGPGANFGKRNPGEQWTSDSAFTPSLYELSHHLAKEIAFPSYNDIGDLTKVASYFVDMVGSRALYERLHDIFDKDYEACAIHTYLSQIPHPLLIVTANYDDLLEKAFKKAGRPYDVVYTLTGKRARGGTVAWWKHNADEPVQVSANEITIDLQKTNVIYKIRGTCIRSAGSAKWDSFVITDDDYLDCIVREANQLAVPASFMDYFSRRHFLFIGYELRDWDMRLVIEKLTQMQEFELPRSWAIQFRPSSVDVRRWEVRAINIYDAEINEFTSQLRETESRLIKDIVDAMDATIQEASPTVFISYAREDEDAATTVYNMLKENGFKPWLDKKEILPGQRWDAKIKSSLKKSDFLIVCMSKKSLAKRGYVQKEVRLALDEAQKMPRDSIYIIPIRLDECEVPDELAEFQYVDWLLPEGLENLIRAISFEWHRRSS